MYKLKRKDLDKEINKAISSLDSNEIVIRIIKRENKMEPTNTYYPNPFDGRLLFTNDLGVVHYHISMSSGQESEERQYACVIFYDADDLEAQKFRDIYGGYTLWWSIGDE